MPTGFTQVLNVFEDLPEERRKQIIEDALKHLKETINWSTASLARTTACMAPMRRPF